MRWEIKVLLVSAPLIAWAVLQVLSCLIEWRGGVRLEQARAEAAVAVQALATRGSHILYEMSGDGTVLIVLPAANRVGQLPGV